jgi:hypothetical protein
VKYGAVVDHIKDKTHKTKVLKIFNSPEGKVNDFYLIDMQVEVYDIVVNHARKEEKKKSEANGAGKRKILTGAVKIWGVFRTTEMRVCSVCRGGGRFELAPEVQGPSQVLHGGVRIGHL